MDKKTRTLLEQDPTILTIECGIGTIDYIEPDNLLLQQVMEAFAIRVKDNPGELLKLLS
jgi:hypothetical protein